MGILYHLLDPFNTINMIGKCAKDSVVIETVIARPQEDMNLMNSPDYTSTKEGFFIRIDTTESATAGLSDLELWPTLGAVDFLVKQNGFEKFIPWDIDDDAPAVFKTRERVMGIAKKR